MVDGLFQDVRFGVRMIAKHPMSSAVTILTLTLGIGLNAAVFTFLLSIPYLFVAFRFLNL